MKIQFIKKETRGILSDGVWYNYVPAIENDVAQMKAGWDVDFITMGKNLTGINRIISAPADQPEFSDYDKQISIIKQHTVKDTIVGLSTFKYSNPEDFFRDVKKYSKELFEFERESWVSKE